MRVSDPLLREKLFRCIPVSADEDVAIRSAVYDAIMLLSERSGLRNPSQLHYLFWNVFRSVCLREDPYCRTPSPDLPERYRHLMLHDGHEECPFSRLCSSVDEPHRYFEHSVATDYY